MMDEKRATQEKYANFRKQCRKVIEARYKVNAKFDVTKFVDSAMKIDKFQKRSFDQNK